MINRPGKRVVVGTNAKLTSIASATAFSTIATANSASAAVYAQIQAAGGTLYLVTDGTTPSNTNYGRKLNDGETYDVTEQNTSWSNIKMIGTSVSIMFSA